MLRFGALVRSHRRLTWCAASALALACGGTVERDGNDGGSTGGGSTGGGSTGGSASGGSSTGGAAADECSPDLDSVGFVEIRLTNATDHALYLGQEEVTCGELELFRLRTEAGDERVISHGDDCFASCSELSDTGCIGLCRFPSAVRLEPGESTRRLWDARYLAPSTLPTRCVEPGQDGEIECETRTTLPEGRYVLSASAYDALDCSETIGSCDDECSPDERGGCTTPAALVAGEAIVAEATLTFGSNHFVGAIGTIVEIELSLE